MPTNSLEDVAVVLEQFTDIAVFKIPSLPLFWTGQTP